MNSDNKQHFIAYFVRTNTMQHEGRISRLFRFLTDKSCKCEAFGVVKKKAGFNYDCTEYIAHSDRISFFPLKIVAKLVEVQWATWRAVRTKYRDADVLILSNYEFLPVGLLLRALGRRNVIIDLHEHYCEGLFRHHWFSRFFFTKLFSGVIFANRMRAEDFVGKDGDFSRIAVTRNLPDVTPGRIQVPAYSDSEKFRIAIVGSALPGRYVREAIRALDLPIFADKIEVMTFGPPVNEQTNNLSVKEHGVFKHWEIDDLMQDVDASLVFYDPTLNGNNRLCEPNRFTQAYNLGKVILCFDHPSLAGFYDQACRRITPNRFDDDLREQVLAAVNEKLANSASGKNHKRFERQLLRYEDGVINLDSLIGFSQSLVSDK